ncbi:hypothetical protein Tco_0272377 [Tanacetum coccineum]
MECSRCTLGPKELKSNAVGIKSFLMLFGVTDALIDVNAAQSKLVLLVNFNENYSKCLRLLEEVTTASGRVNAANEEVSTAELVSTAYVICMRYFGIRSIEVGSTKAPLSDEDGVKPKHLRESRIKRISDGGACVEGDHDMVVVYELRSVDPSTRPSYSPKPSKSASSHGKAECSNCKFLTEKIKTLEAKIKILEGTLEMKRHPENHTFESTVILHELYNDMGRLGLE